jgi:hypothetical protein
MSPIGSLLSPAPREPLSGLEVGIRLRRLTLRLSILFDIVLRQNNLTLTGVQGRFVPSQVCASRLVGQCARSCVLAKDC